MLKKYGKAIEQPQETLPLHLHSEQMDGQSTKSKRRWAAGSKSPVLCGPLLYLLRAGPSRNPEPGFLLGSRPLPSTERGLLRKAEPGLQGLRSQKVKVTEAAPPGTVSCVCSRQPSSGWRSSAAPGRLKSHSHFTSGDLTALRPLCRACPRFLRRQ